MGRREHKGTDFDRPSFVSVIVPVYNGEAVVGGCIESLLAQDYPKHRYEVIIVDNDSTDRTAEIIKRYPVKYVLEDAIHTSYAARNAGARVAKGEALAFCDADQVSHPNWLTALVSRLQPGYGGVAGPCVAQQAKGGVVSAYASADTELRWRRDRGQERDVEFAPTCNVLYRREVFERLGGFTAEAKSSGDVEFSRRVGKELGLRIRYVPAAIQYHRARASLGELLKHEARIGFGDEWLNRKRPGVFVRSCARVLLHLALAGAAAAKALVVVRGPTQRREKIDLITLGALAKLANLYGRLRFRLGLDVPREW